MVATDFAPPFKLIAPYFIIGVLSFVVAVALLFGIDVTAISQTDTLTIAWVHFFLLSFVMMIIFGAMAQLVPVVLEVGHFAVDLYYIIYPLLFVGSVMMAFGFLQWPSLLPYGGTVVLIALLIFVFETFMTINRVKKFNTVITSILLANSFLFLGLLFGIIMALGFAGTISIDIASLLKAHIYLVLFGYVGITIMGISMVLLPMFWLSHSFSWRAIKTALWLIRFGVIFVMFSAISDLLLLSYIGYLLTFAGLFFYIYQIYLIYKTRVRIENDIYLHALLFSYAAFFTALAMGIMYIFMHNERLLLAAGFLALLGFITFIIIGHLYKIIPFLVWYHRFSPLVGKQKVPMLADMVPARSAKFGFGYSVTGVILAAAGILFFSNTLFYTGVSFLLFGALFVLKDILYMISFKG